MLTFRDLQLQVLRYFDVANEPSGSADVQLVNDALNAANAKRSTEERWKFMLTPGVYTLNVVSGQQEYILPHTNVSKLYYLWSTTNKRFAENISLNELERADQSINNTVSGCAPYYEIYEKGSVVAAQPSTASAVIVTSTSSESSTTQLYVEGEDTSGQPLSESLDVGVASSGVYSKITYYAKEGTWQGSLTLATSPGAETLLTLTADEYGKEYPVLKWHDVPQSNEAWEYRYFRTPRIMSRDNDRPDLPFPHSQLLVWDALLDLATYNELDSESVNIWRDKQLDLLNNLYQLKLEGDVVGGVTQHKGSSTRLWR